MSYSVLGESVSRVRTALEINFSDTEYKQILEISCSSLSFCTGPINTMSGTLKPLLVELCSFANTNFNCLSYAASTENDVM